MVTSTDGTEAPVAEDEALYTVDELAALTGMTVRTTRYYAGLGLLPPPVRRGRMAYYSAQHKARLELIRALQDHGFTLAAIEKYLARIPSDASVDDLAVQRAMLTSWKTGRSETATRRELNERAGRVLSDEDLHNLEITWALEKIDEDEYEILPAFEIGIQCLALQVPVDSLVSASQAIDKYMSALADELTMIMRRQVLAPYLEGERTDADTENFQETVTQLRRLTLQAVVTGFQRAANQVITASLSRDD